MSGLPVLDEATMAARLAPPNGPVRLLIDTDTANEIDDQYALAWAFLSPEVCQIEAVTAEPFSFQHHRPGLLLSEGIIDAKGKDGAHAEELNSRFDGWVQRLHRQGRRVADVEFCPPDEGMERSYDEIVRVCGKLGVATDGLVHRGSPGYLTGLDAPFDNAAVEAIIELASSGEAPLYIAAMGCVTNVASAILRAPEIIRNIVLIWTSAYPSSSPHCNGPSLNLVQDPVASRFIFDCGVPHVYLPGYHVGAQLKISLPEMEKFVKGRGAIGDYLWHLYTQNPLHTMFALEDTARSTWVIWDMIDIAWLLNPDWVPSMVVPSPVLDDGLYWAHPGGRHLMREGYDVQRDAVFIDFYDKLAKAPS